MDWIEDWIGLNFLKITLILEKIKKAVWVQLFIIIMAIVNKVSEQECDSPFISSIIQ